MMAGAPRSHVTHYVYKAASPLAAIMQSTIILFLLMEVCVSQVAYCCAMVAAAP